MKPIVFVTIFSAMQLACCGARVRGPEGGLFGIKFRSKPEVMRELMKIKSLDARLVLVAPEDENAPDCLAILDREGKVVQVKFLMPGPVEKSRQAVLKEWMPQGELLALPVDFDPERESYHDARAALLQKPEGGLLVRRRGIFKRKDGNK